MSLTGSRSSLPSFYSRAGGYTGWPLTPTTSSGHEYLVKNEVAPLPLWEVTSAPNAWLKDIPTGFASSAFASSAGYHQADYALAAFANVPSSQSSAEVYKSLIGVGVAEYGGKLPSSRCEGMLLPPPPPSPTTTTSVPTTTTTLKSRSKVGGSSRYSSRSNCTCPNCTEAERLGISGEHLRKHGSVHSCHIPGCGKVYINYYIYNNI